MPKTIAKSINMHKIRKQIASAYDMRDNDVPQEWVDEYINLLAA